MIYLRVSARVLMWHALFWVPTVLVAVVMDVSMEALWFGAWVAVLYRSVSSDITEELRKARTSG